MRLNLHHAEVNTKFPKRIALKTPIFSTLHHFTLYFIENIFRCFCRDISTYVCCCLLNAYIIQIVCILCLNSYYSIIFFLFSNLRVQVQISSHILTNIINMCYHNSTYHCEQLEFNCSAMQYSTL